MKSTISCTELGIVVPTLGTRGHWLVKSLESIRPLSAWTTLVAPIGSSLENLKTAGLVDQIIYRPQRPFDLPASINQAIKNLPPHIQLVSWLNDDDLMNLETGRHLIDVLRANPLSPFSFGSCIYIDKFERPLWKNRSGRLALFLQRFGPNLVPQPGTIIRRSSWDQAGGLDENLRFAFDLDLFLRLSKFGKPISIKACASYVRWHPDALSSKQRLAQTMEAHRSRMENATGLLRLVVLLASPLVIFANIVAPLIVFRRIGIEN